MSTQLDPKPDPFDNLEELKLSQDYVAAAGVRRVLKTVPVRKPGPQEFVRVHPEHRLSPAALIELRDEREIFFVAPGLRSSCRAISSRLACTSPLTAKEW